MTPLDALLASPGRRTVGGVPEGYDAAVLADLARRARHSIIHVARDDARMATLGEALGFFAPDLDVAMFPAWDCLPYDRISPNPIILGQRLSTLARLCAHPPRILLTTVNAVWQRTVAPAAMADVTLTIAKGQDLDLDRLLGFLARAGYVRVSTVAEPGDFALRGGIVDIYPPGEENPIRLDLFGRSVEAIRRFDALNQRSVGSLEHVALRPAGEVWLDQASIARFRAGYLASFGATQDGDPLYAAVCEGRRHLGMEHWLPLFHERLGTLFDFLPGAAVTFDRQAEEARIERRKTIADYFEARRTAPKESDAAYRPLAPERLYMRDDEWARVLAERPTAEFSPFRAPDQPDAGGRPGRDFAPERATPETNLFDAFAKHAAASMATGKRVVFACASAGSRERLRGVLADHGVAGLTDVDHWIDVERLPPTGVGLAVLGIEHGFETEAVALVSEQDLLGDKLSRPAKRAKRAENFIAELAVLAPGDLVVHVDHGIGRFDGLRTVDIGGAPHDCLALAYDGGNLLLPVENLDMLSRYGGDGEAVALDKLGGVAWQNSKARLKKRIRDMADALLKVAAERELRGVEPLAAPEGLYQEFCARFAYEETEDQMRAIDEVVGDLASGKSMDRLVCGDVGFGKTEVALRAAFIAAMAGRQVAVVVPTTLLARQHFRTFQERFRGLPVRIAALSRLVSTKDAARTKTDLAAGAVDIVIGTHALLGKSIVFKDLGLLIVDEEQHFGVGHKERLKQLRSDVQVLTLSATPIPRTLQLAMSGIRDLSMIATPPVDRLAVRTYVMPYDPVVVREALMRERFRGGQSFYVCPRIEDIGDLLKRLAALVPELKIAFAHGGLAPSRIEEVMQAFYDGAFDVLVSTNIVESGLDIPRANTLIVHRADMFGLGQLYQLRGRVGRSKLRAYAYFTLPTDRALGATAEKRLNVLQSLDHLGAGFTLASHDLDLRGAGNLLGEEQSGHIREVGVELYQDMLEQAVQAARAEMAKGQGPAEKWSPLIATGSAVMIPESYVADLSVRMGLYRRVARIETVDEIEAFGAELIDRFGSFPGEVGHLLEIVRIKLLCRIANVEKVDAGPKGAVIALRANAFPNPNGLVRLITKDGARYRLRPDQKLVVLDDWDEPEARLKGVRRLMEKLAGLAKEG